ncbi:MAG: NAD(P)H-hydrate dehydratase [Promethearchaeota archaeon]
MKFSKNLNHSIKIEIIRDSADLKRIEELIKEDNYNLIIDGLLGTGIRGRIREPISSGIDLINSIRKIKRIQVVSIDVPSGLDPNTGIVLDKSVYADLVITFHRAKKGMDTNNKYIKDIVVKSIGIPQEASLFVGKGDFLPTLKRRKINSYKGQYGKILIIGGSKNYSGAPSLASLTCIEFGIDLVITYVPEVIGDVIKNFSPNMIVRTGFGDWLNMRSFKDISRLIDWSNSVLIGPGLGQEKETEELLIKLIEYLNAKGKAYTLDADALKLIKDYLHIIKGQKVILTPHTGELKTMTGITLPPYDEIDKRMELILNLATELKVTLLIKGPYDYISDGQNLKINRTGCSEMTVGGTGDILAGLCACFLAIDNDPFQSACSAAFLNGFIGEFCKKKIGFHFTAMDMIGKLNKAIVKLLDK